MLEPVLRSFLVSALISSAIFAILTIVHWFWPHLFPHGFALWLWPFLFAVAFVPRLIGILAEPLFRRKRHRKT
jgi:hypothetical protein